MKRLNSQIRNQIQDQVYYHVHTQVSDEIIGQVWDQVDIQSVYRLWIYVFMLERRKVLDDETRISRLYYSEKGKLKTC